MPVTATIDRLIGAIVDVLEDATLLPTQLTAQDGSYSLAAPATVRRHWAVQDDGIPETPCLYVYAVNDSRQQFQNRTQIADVEVEILTVIARKDVLDGASADDLVAALERYQQAIGYALESDRDPSGGAGFLSAAYVIWLKTLSTRYNPRILGNEVATSGMIRWSTSRFRFKQQQTHIP